MTDEYIRREDAFDAVEARIAELMTHPEFRRKHLDIDLSGIIRNISAIKPADVVPVFAYKQVMWERDTAVEQLKQIGKGLGEVMDDVAHVVRCKDCRKCSYDPLFNYYWCNLTLGTRRVKPDDFCSYGEREG